MGSDDKKGEDGERVSTHSMVLYKPVVVGPIPTTRSHFRASGVIGILGA